MKTRRKARRRHPRRWPRVGRACALGAPLWEPGRSLAAGVIPARWPGERRGCARCSHRKISILGGGRGRGRGAWKNWILEFWSRLRGSRRGRISSPRWSHFKYVLAFLQKVALCIRLHTRLPASAPSPSPATLLLKQQLLIHGTVQTPGLLGPVGVCARARVWEKEGTLYEFCGIQGQSQLYEMPWRAEAGKTMPSQEVHGEWSKIGLCHTCDFTELAESKTGIVLSKRCWFWSKLHWHRGSCGTWSAGLGGQGRPALGPVCSVSSWVILGKSSNLRQSRIICKMETIYLRDWVRSSVNSVSASSVLTLLYVGLVLGLFFLTY